MNEDKDNTKHYQIHAIEFLVVAYQNKYRDHFRDLIKKDFIRQMKGAHFY